MHTATSAPEVAYLQILPPPRVENTICPRQGDVFCKVVFLQYTVAQCIVIDPVLSGCVCLWVCYHDNSKLRASILTKLGL